MVQWIEHGLQALGSDGKAVRQVVEEAFRQVAGNLASLPSATFTEESPLWAAKWLRLLRKPLFVARRFARGSESESVCADYARDDLRRDSNSYRLLLSGHTHLPELKPLDLPGRRPVPVYLNTGAWRRVHFRVGSTKRLQVQFETWDEECVITTYSPEESGRLGLPSYEFHRATRGVWSAA